MQIGQNRKLAAFYFFKEQDGSAFGLLFELGHNGGEFKGGIDLSSNDEKIVGLFPSD